MLPQEEQVAGGSFCPLSKKIHVLIFVLSVEFFFQLFRQMEANFRQTFEEEEVRVRK